MTKKDLAFHYMPYLISEYNKDEITQKMLLDTIYWGLDNEFDNEDFEWEDISVELRILSETQSIGIITFPIPDDCPEAKYGLIYFDRNSKAHGYYTLELTINFDEESNEDGFMVCSLGFESDAYFHSNYGKLKSEATVDNFIAFIGDLKKNRDR